MLYLVRHLGAYLHVETSLAFRHAGTAEEPTLCESLVDITAEEARELGERPNTLVVNPVRTGWFTSNDCAIHVHDRHSWTVYKSNC